MRFSCCLSLVLLLATGDAFSLSRVTAASWLGRRLPSTLLPGPNLNLRLKHEQGSLVLHAASSSAGNEGASRDALMSTLIDEMMEAAPYELPGIVSRELKLVSSPAFFMAIAAKADGSKSSKTKDSLGDLATTVMTTLDVIVQRTEEKGDVAGSTLQSLLSFAAEEDGEFMVPLSSEKSKAMRAAAKERLGVMDDAFLSTVNAWMRKSEEDGLDGMVTILQTVLQQWASLSLMTSTDDDGDASKRVPTSAVELLDKILATDASEWAALVSLELSDESSRATPKACSKDELLGEVQKRIETTVLGSAAGSYAQRVQAEFLRELTKRVQDSTADAGSGGGGDMQVVIE